MSRFRLEVITALLLSFGLAATEPSSNMNTCMEASSNPSADQCSIEILALSRGRGVPETTLNAFQEVVALANSAVESGTATSIKLDTIGLEGETRLCVVFQNGKAFEAFGKAIRKITTNIDLLEVNEKPCSGI